MIQTKCGIIYEKIAMRAGNDERMINYEWPNLAHIHKLKHNTLSFGKSGFLF